MGSLREFATLERPYTEWCYLFPVSYSYISDLDQHLSAVLVRLKIHDSKSRKKPEYEQAIRRALYARERRLQELKWLSFGGTRVRWSPETID